jgi:hypothetical protein
MEPSRQQLIGQLALLVFAAVVLAIGGVLYLQPDPPGIGIAVCLTIAAAALGGALFAPARLHFTIAQWFLGW